MTYKTLTQLRSKIQTDLDLQDELFITDSELNDIINEAIDDAEAEIHNLYEGYFKTQTVIALVSGTADYALPSNIYANKIVALIYSNGSKIYEITRMPVMGGYMEREIINLTPSSSDELQYDIINATAAAGVKIRFYPTPQETSSTNIKIYYIRNAATLSSDSDSCDIQEFYTYIIQYSKVRCYEKEPGHPNYPAALLERDRLKKLMIETLENMIPDGNNMVEADYSHYEEHS